MPDRKILAFYSPYPGAGKTRAASCLHNKHNFARISFADPIRAIVYNLLCEPLVYGLDKDAPIAEFNNATFRDFMVAIGQAAKKVYPDIWVNNLQAFIKPNFNKRVVIDDLRFPNEYAMLRDKGTKIVRITNPEREIIKSETEGLLEDFTFDYELVNDKSSIKKYRAQLDEMMNDSWP